MAFSEFSMKMPDALKGRSTGFFEPPTTEPSKTTCYRKRSVRGESLCHPCQLCLRVVLALAGLSCFSWHPPVIIRVLALLFAAVLPVLADCADHAPDLANLIDPAKLATLGPRGANLRIQKAVALLEDARRDGCAVSI